MINDSCLICSASDWQLLPNPHPLQSVRSDGSIAPEPLNKLQCMECALVRKTVLDSNSQLAALYEKQYDMYLNRPQAERFDQARYNETAVAYHQLFGGHPPARALEVGCGNGSTLGPLQGLWPDTQCIGIEPAAAAVASARAAGLKVYQGLAGGTIDEAVKGPFGFVYSMNVIEHTVDPREFLGTLISFLAPTGKIALICPDAGEPWTEILLADHLYSFTRAHLRHLAGNAGLELTLLEVSPGGQPCQMLVAHKGRVAGGCTFRCDPVAAAAMFEKRKLYMQQWQLLEEFFSTSTRDKENIYVFGTGGLAAYLAANTPSFWKRVKACTVDGGSDTLFHGKKIVDYRHLHLLKPDVVVIGTNPALQQKLSERLAADGYETLRWNHLVAA